MVALAKAPELAVALLSGLGLFLPPPSAAMSRVAHLAGLLWKGWWCAAVVVSMLGLSQRVLALAGETSCLTFTVVWGAPPGSVGGVNIDRRPMRLPRDLVHVVTSARFLWKQGLGCSCHPGLAMLQPQDHSGARVQQTSKAEHKGEGASEHVQNASFLELSHHNQELFPGVTSRQPVPSQALFAACTQSSSFTLWISGCSQNSAGPHFSPGARDQEHWKRHMECLASSGCGQHLLILGSVKEGRPGLLAPHGGTCYGLIQHGWFHAETGCPVSLPPTTSSALSCCTPPEAQSGLLPPPLLPALPG